MTLARFASASLFLLGLVTLPLACGFPDYGFTSESSASSSGQGGGGEGGGGGGSSTGTAGSGGGGGMGCASDLDCMGSPLGQVCDQGSGACVECLPTNDTCGLGLYCTPSNTCELGCNDDADCNPMIGGGGAGGAGGAAGAGGSGGGAGGAGGSGGSGGAGGAGGSGGAGNSPLTCDLSSHLCQGCAADEQCPPGTVCDLASAGCVPGCTPKHDCPLGLACCSGSCADLDDDQAHCGACDAPCDPPGGQGQCVGGVCSLLGCDPGFNDCDMDPANGCESDPQMDPNNCGMCASPCAPLPNAEPACSGGMCVLGACLAGYGNCDAMAPNGCEVDTSTSVEHCGACGAPCVLANANEVCQAGACAIGSCDAGFVDCDKVAGNGCEVNIQVDAQNCGACDSVCSLPNASVLCLAGSCAVNQCAPPFADCNLIDSDGCETNLNTAVGSCGMCGLACNLPNAAPACSNGDCVVGSCNAGFADCDGIQANGCEVNINTSAANCGGCGAACSANNGVPSCAAGQCSIACNAGFQNCDMAVANGCEINTASNVNNCGMCNNVCPPQGGTPACSNSQCTVSSCAAGFGDCDGNTVNGCETNTTSSTQHCGGCGLACFVANGTAGCAGSTCFVAQCAAGYADCDGQYANGCETNLKTLTSCGACGVACALPNATASCATGTCELVSCNGTFSDCDGSKVNGCEVNTAVSTAHCGGCGNQCSSQNGAASCSSGSCSIMCAAGFGNCDSNVANGCETATTNNVNACGGCGNVCAVQNGVPGCSGTSCVIQSCSAPFASCDGQYANGCETNTATSLTSCGSCGLACTNANGTTSCQSGACSPMCAAGFASCDSNPNNGCETNTNTNLTHCGMCNKACSFANASASCQNGACVLGTCSAGFADCDLNPANGCETPLNTLSNCGGCGVACSNPNGTTACAAGVCAPSCAGGFASCDSNPNNGCETSTTTVANCGGCGVPCDFVNASESCASGVCTFGGCSPGFANCDGNLGNGCEVSTSTSAQHCGGCNSPCAAGKICVSGTCADACPMGSADCDGNMANGCETNTATNGNSCGGCGITCAPTQFCSNAMCVACGAGLSDCDKAGANGCETSTSTNPANCGGCGVKCGSDATCGCSAGACSGGTISFSEDFSDNMKGWTLDPEWQMGSATASSGQEQGNPDPAVDHSFTADNGVAGVLIGSNYTVNPQHGFYYLTSPIVNLSGAAGTVLLTYWRWLNCDYDPYTVHTVEAYNGSAWVTVWSNTPLGSVLITDNAWGRFQHDVTAYKNASFRVRFGFKTAKQGQFLPWIMGGWNIDDVSLSSAVCN